MDMETGDLATWAGVGASVLMSAGALVVSLFGLKWQRISAEATVRSANADEKAHALAMLLHEKGEVAAEPAEPPLSPIQVERSSPQAWELERPRKNRFVLRNISSMVLTGVTVDPEQFAGFGRQLPNGAAVRPGASLEFLVFSAGGKPVPNEIAIRWDGRIEPLTLPTPPPPS